jgi:hypothetical protein
MSAMSQFDPANPLGLKGPAWTVHCIVAQLIGMAKAAAERGHIIRFLMPVLIPWLDRLGKRFVALAGKYDAGTLRPRHARPAAPATPVPAGDAAAGEAGKPGRARPFLPRERGWLVQLLPDRAPSVAAQLLHLLKQPDTLALLNGAPQLARLLRPLMRMLTTGPMPDCLRLPPRPRRAREDGAPRRRRRLRPAGLPPAPARKPAAAAAAAVAAAGHKPPSWVPAPPPLPPPLGNRITGWPVSPWPDSSRTQYDLRWLPGYLRPRTT